MVLLLALLIDWFFGDPNALWKRVPHPVVMIGNAIGFLDTKLRRNNLSASELRQRGIVLVVAIVGGSLFTGAFLSSLFHGWGVIGWLLEIGTVVVFLAQKSLREHVEVVAGSLRTGGVEEGRSAVANIVGRNTHGLDQSGICRAAIESLAENYSDGIVAPAIWYVFLGLPGLIAYKAINTADSMIGHKTQRYLDFGRAAAILDDVVNWPAARLSALLLAIASTIDRGFRHGVAVMDQVMQEAGNHRSPNAGWPETAMAASLNIVLGGPRSYGSENITEPAINVTGQPDLTPADIDAALAVFKRGCFALWALAFLVA